MPTSEKQPRIFYLAWTEPSSASGACLAIYRHLVVNKDFDVFVATDKKVSVEPHKSLYLSRSIVHQRLSRTRLRRIISQFEMTFEPYLMVRKVERHLREFRPDALFTVPDNTLSWSAYLLARKMGIPLITNFQDWWPRGQFWSHTERPISVVRTILERRFRSMHRASSLVFCTSAGMEKYLGHHANSVVLYPCPAPRLAREVSSTPNYSAGKRFRIVFAGTIVGEYGKRLLALAKAIAHIPDLELVLYGNLHGWNKLDIEWASNNGIYQGFLPFEKLREKLNQADAFLVVMSSAPELRIMMQTSFTTKFLEYSQFGKPILVWGPSYCEPIRVAKETGGAIPIEQESEEGVLTEIQKIRDPETWLKLAEAAANLSLTIFDHDRIHGVFRDSIFNLLKKNIAG